MLGSWNSFQDSQVLAPWLEAHEQLLRKETVLLKQPASCAENSMIPAFVRCCPRQGELLLLQLPQFARSCNSPNKPDWATKLNFPVFIVSFLFPSSVFYLQ